MKEPGQDFRSWTLVYRKYWLCLGRFTTMLIKALRAHFTQRASFIAPFCHKYWRKKHAVFPKRIAGSKLNKESVNVKSEPWRPPSVAWEGCSFHSAFVKTLSVFTTISTKSAKPAAENTFTPIDMKSPKTLEKMSLPLAALLTLVSRWGYCSLPSLNCIEKQQCAGKELLTLYCSPQTLQDGKKEVWSFPRLSWVTLNPFNSLLPLVPRNNFRVSHSRPAPPDFYHPTPYQVTSRCKLPRCSASWHGPDGHLPPCSCTSEAYFSEMRTWVGMLACISTKAATERACVKKKKWLRGATGVQAVPEGRQTQEHRTHDTFRME